MTMHPYAVKQPELLLLLACAKPYPGREDEAAIRQLLEIGIDWSTFARKAVDHGLASLVGHTLARVAADLVPEDILAAFRTNVDETRKRNRLLLDELARLLGALSDRRITAIPFKGPVLAVQAYGDVGLRVFTDLDFLVHDRDLDSSVTALLELGYERKDALTKAQVRAIQRLQGQDFVFNRATDIGVEPHTRLTPSKMALDIDYAGLWSRAQPRDVDGRSMLTLAPEDDLLVLAIHGGKEMWWSIKWAADVAAFIGSHPQLDWSAALARAREQGCVRMLLLAASLARTYFQAAVPAPIIAAECIDPAIGPMVERIVAGWEASEPLGAPSNKTLSMDRLRLHDGILRRTRYWARTVFLSYPGHVASLPLPAGLSFAYAPIKIAHDGIALPLWRGYQQALMGAGRLWEALAVSDLALALTPASREARLSMKTHRETHANAKRALAANPNNLAALWSLADALFGLKRYKQAIAYYDRALEFSPDNRGIWRQRGAAMAAFGKRVELPQSVLNPRDANAWAMRAGALAFSGRFAEAVGASDRALSLEPSNRSAMRIGIHSRLHSCDWRRRAFDKSLIAAGLKSGDCVLASSDHLSLSESEEENLINARYVAKGYPPSAEPQWRGERYRHDKIRIAYVSADFHAHATALSTAGIFECHDRTHFETTAISLGPDDGSEMRRRIKAAFERFVDVRAMSDGKVAAMLRELEIDIAVDLKGYTAALRTGIFAHRASPIQVNYLGYPGTMALPFIDYIIADRVVIPEENRVHYSENVICLPHSYRPSDSKRRIAEDTPSRSVAGLPETGFVFACFNDTYKIGPEMFDVWMRLLRAVDNSILWLPDDNESTSDNLKREAAARNVNPERLVFAPRCSSEEQLARQRLADLFLDTLPYNAHATASDALWAGVPLITCSGKTFPARVAASLLYAVGLPELVTSSLAAYENLALALARDPARMAAIKTKLICNRDAESLFDTVRFTRYLEHAYRTAWERQQAGLPPASFAVPD
jgi:predicted O-linked N-acetylglucosamine transferase (SPINDLY family)